ncbi:MAG: hypothetical protein ACHQ49_13280 [Elusimicrobiota bacterium]
MLVAPVTAGHVAGAAAELELDLLQAVIKANTPDAMASPAIPSIVRFMSPPPASMAASRARPQAPS